LSIAIFALIRMRDDWTPNEPGQRRDGRDR